MTQKSDSSPTQTLDKEELYRRKPWVRPATEEDTRAFWDRLRPGGERLREALSGAPYWAEGERKAMARGGPQEVEKYWSMLFLNEINLHRPPKNKDSTAADEQTNS